MNPLHGAVETALWRRRAAGAAAARAGRARRDVRVGRGRWRGAVDFRLAVLPWSCYGPVGGGGGGGGGKQKGGGADESPTGVGGVGSPMDVDGGGAGAGAGAGASAGAGDTPVGVLCDVYHPQAVFRLLTTSGLTLLE